MDPGALTTHTPTHTSLVEVKGFGEREEKEREGTFFDVRYLSIQYGFGQRTVY